MRPMLRPGTHVLQRGAGEVQVGLDPATALVLPEVAAVTETLRLLALAADTAAYDDRGTLDLLTDHRQVVDERDLVPLLADTRLDATTAAALARSAGPAAPHVRRRREDARTATETFGHHEPGGLRDALVRLTGAAGLRELSPRAGTPPTCRVLVGVGEPHRDRLDAWVQDGTPHLLVRLTEGRAVLGPFVVPGETACLRCVDTHYADADPEWPLLVEQYATASARPRPDGTPEPVDPLLAALAVAWAARDLASYVDGLRPSTWSATVSVHPHLARLETRAWLRHPACGCSWE